MEVILYKNPTCFSRWSFRNTVTNQTVVNQYDLTTPIVQAIKISLSKLTQDKKAIKATFARRLSPEDTIEIQIGKDKKFKKKKSLMVIEDDILISKKIKTNKNKYQYVSKSKKASITMVLGKNKIKKALSIKRKKAVYIRVRGIRTLNGVKTYTKWSTVKSIKLK